MTQHQSFAIKVNLNILKYLLKIKLVHKYESFFFLKKRGGNNLILSHSNAKGVPARATRATPCMLVVCFLEPGQIQKKNLTKPNNNNDRRGSIPLWVQPLAYTIFYFLIQGCTP